MYAGVYEVYCSGIFIRQNVLIVLDEKLLNVASSQNDTNAGNRRSLFLIRASTVQSLAGGDNHLGVNNAL